MTKDNYLVINDKTAFVSILLSTGMNEFQSSYKTSGFMHVETTTEVLTRTHSGANSHTDHIPTNNIGKQHISLNCGHFMQAIDF